MVQAKGTWNQIVYWSRLLDWKNQTLTPNPDVIYLFPFYYDADAHTLTKKQIGTRYVMVGIRTFVDSVNPGAVKQVHALQDAIKVSQAKRSWR